METQQMSKGALWTARIMCALAVLILLADSIGKLLKTSQNVQGFQASGFDPALLVTVGIILLLCLIIFMIPRTAFLGALLLTAYLGGATAMNVLTKLGPVFIALPIITCIFIWSGLYVTSPELRYLLKNKINSRN